MVDKQPYELNTKSEDFLFCLRNSFARQLSLNFTVLALFDIIFQLTPLKLLLFHLYSLGLTIATLSSLTLVSAGLPLFLISKLQRIQNHAAHLVVHASSSVHVTQILKQLHWLPIKTCISYKIASLCFNTIDYSTPAYLSDLLHLYSPSRSLHSGADTCLLKLPLYKCKMKGDRAFSYSGPSVWNSLPLHIKNAMTIATFISPLSNSKPISSTFKNLISSVPCVCVCVCVCVRAHVHAY